MFFYNPVTLDQVKEFDSNSRKLSNVRSFQLKKRIQITDFSNFRKGLENFSD